MKWKKKALALILAFLTFTSTFFESGVLTQADPENIVTLKVLFPEKGGKIGITLDSEQISLYQDQDGNYIKNMNGSEEKIDSGSLPREIKQYGGTYALNLEVKIGSRVDTTVTVEKGYEISRYQIMTASGETILKEAPTQQEYNYKFTVTDNTTVDCKFVEKSQNKKASEKKRILFETSPKEEASVSTTKIENDSMEKISEKPLYDAKKIYKEAQEIGVGYAESEDDRMLPYLSNPNARWTSGDERYAGGLVPNSTAGITIDIVQYRPGGNNILNSWREGVLGFKDKNDPNNTSKQERAFCAAPKVKFKAGTFVCQPMEERYNYQTLQLVCAMLKYIDDQEIYHQHLSENNLYALRQCAIWAVLNTVEGWYPQDAYIEFGNGVHCPYDSSCYISSHVSDLMNNGWAWAHDNYSKMKPKNCYYWYNKNYPSTRQPISTWDYDYTPDYWLAVQKKPTTNKWTWIDGSNFATQEDWANWAVRNNPSYDLTGAKYTAWNEDTGEYFYDCITTDANGYGWCYLPAGRYQIQESVPPKGYIRDETWYKVDLGTTNYTFHHPEPIKTAEIRLHKSAAEPTSQSLAGAKYGVYWNQEDIDRKSPQYIITTDASGYGEVKDIPLWNYYVKEIEAPEGFGLDTKVYMADCTNPGTYADIGVDLYSEEPLQHAKITLQKQSANPECTDNNDAYSLQGAEYSIYNDPECTDYVDKMITDETGYAEKTGLNLKQYYVKETKASQGYGLDKTIYPVDLTTGSGNLEYQVVSKEVPLLDPISLLIKKVDKDTGNPVPEGQGSLEGAEFTFKFYKGEYPENTDPETLGKTEDKIWVFATDKTGYIDFAEDYKVSGDSFYYNAIGLPSLPVGTLVITETKAPTGYHINPETIIVKITPPGTIQGAQSYVTPEIKEDSVSVKIIKVQDGKDVRIPGTVFRHTMPDGTTKDYATDNKGEIQLQGLAVGKHQVVELSPAEGFLPNTSVFEFEVTADNQVQAITQPTPDMGISFAEEKNGDGTLTVKNKLAPFKLNIHKVNNKNTVLEGAEFTLYEDKECSVEVDKQVSNQNGDLSFKNIETGRDYYLKETKAPAGYKLPINGDGSQVVYKIKVESDPLKDQFIVYVNDKAYDANSQGSITIGGTKGAREVNITVLNTVNGKLPNTGSQSMIWILTLGMIFMVFALKNNKKTLR